MDKLSKSQRDSMIALNQYVGETVDVLTSGYTANVNPEFVARAVGGTHSSAGLRGLERRGFIRIEVAMWKGARVTVLKAADLG